MLHSLRKKLHPNTLYIGGIILLTLFYLLPLFQPSFYVSHDGENQVARFAAYYNAFLDGHFPPRWAGNLNYGYGSPVFIFFYPLPGYLSSVMHLMGISFEVSFKLLIALSFLLAPIGFYVWSKLHFKKEVAFVGALLYGFLPYHFLDLYIRGDIGELIALACVPFVFYFIDKIIASEQKLKVYKPTKKHTHMWTKIHSLLNVPTKRYILFGGLLYALLILSHNGISLMFSPVFVLYCFLRMKNKLDILQFFSMLLLGLMLAAFFWIPAIYESRYTNIHLFIGDMFKDHYPTINELIYSDWGFGPNVRDTGGLSPQIGIVYVLLAVASIYMAIREKKNRKIILGWLFVFFIAVFITLPISTFVWNLLPLLRVYEFPWRFVALASFASVVLGCYVLARINNKRFLVAVFLLVIISSIPFVKVKEYLTYPDNYYITYKGTTYYHGEASPIWTAGDPSKSAKAPVEFIENTGKITNISRKNHIHTFTIESSGAAKLVDNTAYFPGWKVTVDGTKTPIEFQDQNYRGLITFTVPEGKHNIKVEFTESPIRILANVISIASIITIGSLII